MNKFGSPNPLMMISYDEATPRPESKRYYYSYSSLSEPGSLLQTPSCKASSPTNSSNTTSKQRLGRRSRTFAYRIRDHVRLGRKLTETVKGKLRLGARIIQEGGRENLFKQIFGVSEGEQVLKASQCYLSTTAGPIGGLLFISTLRITFCSDSSITFRSPHGHILTTHYKVVIPVKKIKKANQSENVEKPAQKYMEIQTEDNHEFWFMGFLRYEKAFKNLQKAISMANS